MFAKNPEIKPESTFQVQSMLKSCDLLVSTNESSQTLTDHSYQYEEHDLKQTEILI